VEAVASNGVVFFKILLAAVQLRQKITVHHIIQTRPGVLIFRILAHL
jgi:hypothetical protein